MTNTLYSDAKVETIGKTLPLGFESSEAAMLAGIRVRPADLARLLGVSKQAVSSWVKDGRVVLGVDGRVDPRAAINRLLATGDPSRLRAKFLAPVIGEMSAARRRIAELELSLATALDDAGFHESAALEMLGILNALKNRLEFDWYEIRKLPHDQGLTALLLWMDEAMQRGADPGCTIPDIVARSEAEKEGRDFDAHSGHLSARLQQINPDNSEYGNDD